MKLNLKMWKDMLTEKAGNETFYSQGRVYLLFSVIAYYITLGFVTWKALHPNTDIAETTLKTIIEALQWSIALFAGYAFGGKVVSTVKSMFGKTTEPTTPQNGNGDTTGG
jgi:hypothetical protein